MPRISASTVEEHVARQEKRVFDAAVSLFTERGYGNVSFGDIAHAVGLARNSLYRYFPSKADILIRWFRIELAGRIERSTELLAGQGDPQSLITAWVEDQLDYAAQPEHALLASMSQVEPTLADEARDELFGIHSRLLAPLCDVLGRAGVRSDSLAATGELINGLVLSAARYEARHASPDAIARHGVHSAIDALIANAADPPER